MRNIPDEMKDILETSCRDVEEFQEEVKVAQNTAVELQRMCHEKHR